MDIVNDSNFKDKIASGVVVVDFGADWCGPCRMITPALDELAKELSGKATIVKLDVDDSPDTAAAQSVRAIPCLIIFKDGVEKSRSTGAQSKSSLKKWIEENL